MEAAQVKGFDNYPNFIPDSNDFDMVNVKRIGQPIL